MPKLILRVLNYVSKRTTTKSCILSSMYKLKAEFLLSLFNMTLKKKTLKLLLRI